MKEGKAAIVVASVALVFSGVVGYLHFKEMWDQAKMTSNRVQNAINFKTPICHCNPCTCVNCNC